LGTIAIRICQSLIWFRLRRVRFTAGKNETECGARVSVWTGIQNPVQDVSCCPNVFLELFTTLHEFWLYWISLVVVAGIGLTFVF
jgi:hypothetical protein